MCIHDRLGTLVREFDEHHKPRLPLHKGGDVRAARTFHQIALPMTRDRTVFHLGRSFAYRDSVSSSTIAAPSAGTVPWRQWRAEGDNSRRVPRLAGQRYEYLLRQLHDAVEGRRPNMAGGRARLLERFDVAEFTALADYMSRLPVSAPRTQRLELPQ